MGYYIDLVFDLDLVPTWQHAAALFKKEGAQVLSDPSHSNSDRFVDLSYPAISHPITVYKALPEKSKGHWADVRLSWTEKPDEMERILGAILDLSDSLGCVAFDGQSGSCIVRENIGEIISYYSKTARNVIGLTGKARGNCSSERKNWVNTWIDEAYKERASELNFSFQHIDAVPPEIGKLERLQVLLFGGNVLSSLPIEIGLLQNLKYLSLMGNRFETIPEGVLALQGLISLSLSGNRFTELDPQIEMLAGLQWLDIGRNRIASLCPEICLLSRLEHLDLTANLLKLLPPGFDELRQLKCLRLSRNRLSILPYQICRLKNLTHLELDGNNLSVLPPEIGCLINLEELYLHLNPLISLPKEMLNLVSLRRLRLPNFGPFTDIPTDVDSQNPRELLKYVFSERLGS